MTRSDSISRASLWLGWRILGCQEWKHAGKPGDFVAEEEKDGGLDDSNGGDRQRERLCIVCRQRLQGPSLLASSDSTDSNPFTLEIRKPSFRAWCEVKTCGQRSTSVMWALASCWTALLSIWFICVPLFLSLPDNEEGTFSMNDWLKLGGGGQGSPAQGHSTPGS